MMATATRSRPAVLGATLGLASLALVITACGGGSKPTTSSAGTPAPTTSGAPNRANIFADLGTVSGMVEAISGATASIKESDGTSSSIAWASQTRFSTISAISLSALAKGDCVSVTGARRSTSTNAPAQTVTAASVSVTSTNGCTGRSGFGGFPGGGGGGLPGGGNGSPPPFSNFATPRPSGSPGLRGGFGNGRGFGGAFGTVTSISGSTIVVTSPIGNGSRVTVKTTAQTTYSSTAQASASDVTSGICVSAIGTKTSTGRINAQTITLSAPANGKCATQAFGPGGRGFGFGARPSPSSSPGVANA